MSGSKSTNRYIPSRRFDGAVDCAVGVGSGKGVDGVGLRAGGPDGSDVCQVLLGDGDAELEGNGDGGAAVHATAISPANRSREAVS